MCVGLCGSRLSHTSFPLLPISTSQGKPSAPKLFLLYYHFPAYPVFLHSSHTHLANLWPSSSAEALWNPLNYMRQGRKRDFFVIVQCLPSLHKLRFCSCFEFWFLSKASPCVHLSNEKSCWPEKQGVGERSEMKIMLSRPVCK